MEAQVGAWLMQVEKERNRTWKSSGKTPNPSVSEELMQVARLADAGGEGAKQNMQELGKDARPLLWFGQAARLAASRRLAEPLRALG